MTTSPSTSPLDADMEPGKPAMLRAEATRDAARWADEHTDRAARLAWQRVSPGANCRENEPYETS
jgi:hypothetical protein